MVCSEVYNPVSATPAVVIAPITAVTVRKVSETATDEAIEIWVTVGDGSGAQPTYQITMPGRIMAKPRRPNTLDIWGVTIPKNQAPFQVCVE